MNIYKLLKLNRKIKSHRIKFLGLFLLHKFNQRYLAVNLDPVMACNLRCKMCYFTDADYVKTLKGQFKEEELKQVAKTIFKRALKLQIGCGTEPTLYKDLVKVVELGKMYKVPYISITTNANLLDEQKIENLLKAGLNEFTISLHGVTNQHFDGNSFDILQIRPIQKIGNTEYCDFDLETIRSDYPSLIKNIKNSCKENNIILMAPDEIPRKKETNPSSLIFDYTFCYVSPQKFWKEGFDWKNVSFNAYSKKIGWGSILLNNAFKSKSKLKSLTNRLNYEIEFN